MKQSFNSLKVIFLSVIVLVILISLTVLSIAMYPTYAYKTFDVDISNSNINTYSDKVSKGNSFIKIIREPGVTGYNCMINKGHAYPYCITQINFSELIDKGIDFNDFYKMTLYGTYSPPKKTDFLRITLLNYNPEYSDSGKMHTYKYNLIELQSQSLEFPIEFNLEDLNVPLWWASNMRKKNVDTQLELDNITTIEISTGTEASYGSHKLRINKIQFESMVITINELYEYIIIVWGALLFIFAVITMIALLVSLKKTKRNERNLIAINEVLSNKSAELELINKHDELTGLLNRTGLKSKMVECLDKKLYPLTVAMIDVDFFKKINDTYGHQKGDYVLSSLGSILKEFVQDEESVSRFGGEEFILLMPEKTVEDVIERLDSLRKRIENSDMEIDQSVTASFGLASTKEYSGIKDLIDSADSALYEAKNDGRNCIRVCA